MDSCVLIIIITVFFSVCEDGVECSLIAYEGFIPVRLLLRRSLHINLRISPINLDDREATCSIGQDTNVSDIGHSAPGLHIGYLLHHAKSVSTANRLGEGLARLISSNANHLFLQHPLFSPNTTSHVHSLVIEQSQDES